MSVGKRELILFEIGCKLVLLSTDHQPNNWKTLSSYRVLAFSNALSVEEEADRPAVLG